MTEKEKRTLCELNWLGSQRGGLPAYKRRICEEAALLIDRLLPDDKPANIKAEKRCLDAGCEDVILFAGESYDTALVGVTEDNRAVYDFEKMVEWLMENQGIDREAAMDWICYNTICDLPNAGPSGPIIMYRI